MSDSTEDGRKNGSKAVHSNACGGYVRALRRSRLLCSHPHAWKNKFYRDLGECKYLEDGSSGRICPFLGVGGGVGWESGSVTERSVWNPFSPINLLLSLQSAHSGSSLPNLIDWSIRHWLPLQPNPPREDKGGNICVALWKDPSNRFLISNAYLSLKKKKKVVSYVEAENNGALCLKRSVVICNVYFFSHQGTLS